MKTYKSTDNTQLTAHFNSREFRCKCGGSHDADDWFFILLLLAFTMNNTDPEKIKMEELNNDEQEPYSCNPEQAS